MKSRGASPQVQGASKKNMEQLTQYNHQSYDQVKSLISQYKTAAEDRGSGSKSRKQLLINNTSHTNHSKQPFLVGNHTQNVSHNLNKS
jgi:hypothetical protein